MAGLPVNAPKEPRILGDIITYHRLSRLCHPASNPLPQGDAKLLCLGRASHGDKDQLLRRDVEQCQTTPLPRTAEWPLRE